jgi:hypothetical protein
MTLDVVNISQDTSNNKAIQLGIKLRKEWFGYHLTFQQLELYVIRKAIGHYGLFGRICSVCLEEVLGLFCYFMLELIRESTFWARALLAEMQDIGAPQPSLLPTAVPMAT